MRPPWVSFRSNILDNNTGPNSEIVALSLTPFSLLIVRNSVVICVGDQSIPVFSARSFILGFSVPF